VNIERIKEILGMSDKPVDKPRSIPTPASTGRSATRVGQDAAATATAREPIITWKVGDRVCFVHQRLGPAYEVSRIHPWVQGDNPMIELLGMFGLYAAHLFVQAPANAERSLAASLPSLYTKPEKIESKMLEDLRIEKTRLRREIEEHEKAVKELELKAGGLDYQISWLERHPEAEEIFNFVEEVRRRNASDSAEPGLHQAG
jgi:hypothetical protein